MGIRYKFLLLSAAFTGFLYSCKNTPAKNHGPIVLGDSSTIVTEKDPRKLLDLVTDLQPDIPPAANSDTPAKTANQTTAVQEPKKDSAKSNIVTSQPDNQSLPDVAGLKAEFKEISILIPGITAKISGNPNLKGANSAVYTLLSGSLDDAAIKTKGNITKVMQKCQSVVVLKNKLGTLPLDNLSGTSDWEQVKGNKNSYPVTDIDEESLPYPKVNNYAIRSAVSRAATRRRMSHKKVQEWVNSVASVHSANQKPLVITLRSIIWKIDGKDDNGKAFSKQIRIDVPL